MCSGAERQSSLSLRACSVPGLAGALLAKPKPREVAASCRAGRRQPGGWGAAARLCPLAPPPPAWTRSIRDLASPVLLPLDRAEVTKTCLTGVHSCCQNPAPQTGQLEQQTSIACGSGSWKPATRAPTAVVSGESPPRGLQTPSVFSSSRAGALSKISGVSPFLNMYLFGDT